MTMGYKHIISAINKAVDIGLKRVKVNVVISSVLKPEDIEGFMGFVFFPVGDLI